MDISYDQRFRTILLKLWITYKRPSNFTNIIREWGNFEKRYTGENLSSVMNYRDDRVTSKNARFNLKFLQRQV